MLEQRIQQQFFESADLQYECAEGLAREVSLAAQALLNTLTAGGRLLLFGAGAARAVALHAQALFIGRFERERPPLAAVLLDAAGAGALAAPQLLALGQPGDTLLLFENPARSDEPDDGALACVEAAHLREASVVVVARARPPTWTGRLQEGDVLVALPHDRPARVLEAQLLVLHALADALDHQLIGEQDPG